MSFPVNLYTMTDHRNKIGKNLGNATAFTGTLREECNVVDPVILIETSNPTGFNYAFIEAFGNRYYFIKEIKSVRNGLWEVYLHVDVLETYATAIKSSPCIVGRNSSRFNLKLNDPEFVCAQNDLITIQTFPNGFNTAQAHYILNIIGNRTQTAP